MEDHCLICYEVCDPLEANPDLKSKILSTFFEIYNFNPNLIQEIKHSSGVTCCPPCIEDLQRAQGILEFIKLYQDELADIKSEVDHKLKKNTNGTLRMKIIGHIEVDGLKRRLASMYPDPSPTETHKEPVNPKRKKPNINKPKRKDLSLGGIFGDNVRDVKPLVTETDAVTVEEQGEWSPTPEDYDVSDEETQESSQTGPSLSPEEKDRLRSECLSNQPVLSLDRVLGSEDIEYPNPEVQALIKKRKNRTLSFGRRKELDKVLKRKKIRKREDTDEDENESNVCHECGKSFSRHYNLKNHMKSAHGDNKANKAKCSICSKEFRKSYLQEHMFIHSESSQFLCPHCGKSFNRKTLLDSHTRNLHPPPEAINSYQCTHCLKPFHSGQQLRRHVRKVHEVIGIMSNEATEVACNHEGCGKLFKSSYYLNEHVKRVHEGGENSFLCDICPKRFAEKYRLERHKLTHNEMPRPYACDQCEANYNYKEQLEVHVNQIHAKNHNHFCEICGKGFYNQQLLNDHLRKHPVGSSGSYTQKGKIGCSFCYNKFKTEEEKNEHELSHSVDINFQCKGCDEVFKGPKHLKDHYKAMHTLPVQQGLTCQCGKVFKRQKILNKHLREVCGREKVKGRPRNS